MKSVIHRRGEAIFTSLNCLGKMEVSIMTNEDKKDFNAMLHKDTDMPKVQIVTDEATICCLR